MYTLVFEGIKEKKEKFEEVKAEQAEKKKVDAKKVVKVEAEEVKVEKVEAEAVKAEEKQVVVEQQEEKISASVATEAMSQVKVEDKKAVMNGDVKTPAPAKQAPAAAQQNGHAVNGVAPAAGANDLAPKFVGSLEETVSDFSVLLSTNCFDPSVFSISK